MKNRIGQIALVVRDYNEAIEYYTTKLDFILKEDTKISETKRWVVIEPEGAAGVSILLAKASGAEQEAHIGNQTGGRVFLFLYTDDFDAYFHLIESRGVNIVRPPKTEPYGKVAVFEDIYGNLWDLIGTSNDHI